MRWYSMASMVLVTMLTGGGLGGCRSASQAPTDPATSAAHAFAAFAPAPAPAGSLHQKARLAWWQAHYPELTAQDDARVTKIHAIFARLRHAAGTRPGVEPRLYITRDAALTGPAVSLPDGSIILSKQALDICYRVPQHGDDRLAFVLAHELAHQLKDDFWHLRSNPATASFTPVHH
ncbi:MAG: hypothetical protein AB7N91_16865 [Candidatus Tectimicrobiota bacterium]